MKPKREVKFIGMSDGPNQTYRLYNVEPGVTDDLRRLMMVPSLANAKAREAEMNKMK